MSSALFTILPFIYFIFLLFFFFIDPPTTEIYTLSLHDALPICCLHSRAFRRKLRHSGRFCGSLRQSLGSVGVEERTKNSHCARSEEHTSELQSHVNLVCRLLLEKKKQGKRRPTIQNRPRQRSAG